MLLLDSFLNDCCCKVNSMGLKFHTYSKWLAGPFKTSELLVFHKFMTSQSTGNFWVRLLGPLETNELETGELWLPGTFKTREFLEFHKCATPRFPKYGGVILKVQ